MRVFIADDEQGIVELIKHLITVEKCEIVGEANNGLDALHKIREQQPDIVITDIMMPLMNGIDLIREVLCLLRTIFLETTYASCSGSTPASISNFVFLRIFGAFKASPSLSPTLPMKR